MPQIRAVAVVLAGLALGIGGSPGAALASPPPPPEVAAEIARLMASGDVPGLSIAVVRGGELAWEGALGVRNAVSGEPVTTDTLFEAASLSKPVFAYVVLRLADRGEIDLDWPLAALLPNPRLEHDPRSHRITPRMVLSHTTGLPNWGGTPLELAAEPGERFGYSGEGMVYLQQTVELLTGLGLDELARREVFRPLGMSRSGFVPPRGLTVADGHDAWGRPESRVYDPGDANAAGSLMTTAGDYARFLAAVLGGRGLDPVTWRRMLTPHSAVRPFRGGDVVPGLFWGLGWGLERAAAAEGIFHWGDNGNFKAYVVGYPASGDGLVYLANTTDGLDIAQDLVALVAPGEHPAIEWAGYERHDDPRRTVRRQVGIAFFDGGAAAGAARYRELAATLPEGDRAGVLGEVVEALLARQRPREAVAAAELETAERPDDAAAHAVLGDARLAAGEEAAALASYRRALELDADSAPAAARVRWAEEAVAARQAPPVVVPAARLAEYAGDYGPRHVRLRDGRLYYQRDGRPEYPLVALSGDTFVLEGMGTFRVRFVSGDDGRVAKLVGLYHTGEEDDSPRSP